MSRLHATGTTVLQAERGRDPRQETLCRYRDVLPSLLPAALLGAGDARVPPSLDAAWTLQRDLVGVVARRLTLRVVVSGGHATREIVIESLRSLDGPLRDPGVRANVVALALAGATSIPRYRASEADARARTATCASEHGELTLRFTGTLTSVDLRWTERRPMELAGALAGDAAGALELGTAVALELPVEELRLELAGDGAFLNGRLPQALAWASPFPPGRGADVAPLLHPCGSGVRPLRGAPGLRLAVRRPLVGVVHALGWTEAPERAAARGGPIHPVACARRRAGLSVRALAERIGVSPTTMSELEAGRDARGSTLRGCVHELAELSPWALLTGSRERLCPDEAWAYVRGLYGCEAEEEAKIVRLADDGDAAIEIRTQALVRLRDAPGDFRVRIGYTPGSAGTSRASLREVRPSKGAAEPLRIAPLTGPAGQRLHELIIPARSARSGVTYTRRLVHAGLYAVTARRAQEKTGDPGPHREGASFATSLPARRLRLSVRFPRAAAPVAPRVHAWPLVQPPDDHARELASLLHPAGLSLTTSRDGRTLSIVVECPLPHVKYSLSWQLA